MYIWLDKSIEYINNRESGSRNFGNHGVIIKRNCDGEKEYHFTYFGSSVVILNKDKATITVNNFGYSSGTTPRVISSILNQYSYEDYDVIQIGNTQSNYYYNYCTKYFIGVYDGDVKDNNWTGKKRNSVISTVVTIPKGVSHKQFRDQYFQKIVEDADIKFLGKCPGGMGDHYGICYRFSGKHFWNTGTLIFSPVSNKLSKRVYLKIR